MGIQWHITGLKSHGRCVYLASACSPSEAPEAPATKADAGRGIECARSWSAQLLVAKDSKPAK